MTKEKSKRTTAREQVAAFKAMASELGVADSATLDGAFNKVDTKNRAELPTPKKRKRP